MLIPCLLMRLMRSLDIDVHELKTTREAIYRRFTYYRILSM